MSINLMCDKCKKNTNDVSIICHACSGEKRETKAYLILRDKNAIAIILDKDLAYRVCSDKERIIELKGVI